MRTEEVNLKELLYDAEMILVGIGHEFRVEPGEIESDLRYRDYFNKVKEMGPDFAWLKPYLSAHFFLNYEGEILNAYSEIYNLIREKEYFIVSLNDDSIINKVNFNQEQVVMPCGTIHLLQCEHNCSGILYKSEKIIYEVMEECERNFNEFYKMEGPKCPKCGANLVFNNLFAQSYEENGYLNKWEIYTKWLQNTLNKKICILELGVGMEYPSIIRWPFEKIAFYNKKAKFVRMHHKLFQLTEEIKENGLSIKENALTFFKNKIV